jgi:hypothetical protein
VVVLITEKKMKTNSERFFLVLYIYMNLARGLETKS